MTKLVIPQPKRHPYPPVVLHNNLHQSDYMACEPSKSHYYPDGDVAIIVPPTIFKVHSLILSIGSNFFKTRMSGEWSDVTERAIEVLDTLAADVRLDVQRCRHRIFIDDEKPQDVGLLLSFLYPNYRDFSWDKIAALWRLADKYLAEALTDAVRTHVQKMCHQDPLTSLILAEQYDIAAVYEPMSAHIVENLHKYESDALFSQLSVETRCKLYQHRLKIIENLANIELVYISCQSCADLCNDQLKVVLHDKAKDSILQTIKTIQAVPNFPYEHTKCSVKVYNVINHYLRRKFGSTEPTIEVLERHPSFRISLSSSEPLI
ncbi:hypothetical protein BC938DRAFT_477526 [Jimgerdemannia flammicorona]|uniref:BTB domain-containing protein n=1 Tax=Jimgerdemannia flammicorona TaxID=994334 RepID=A0A433P9A3_9FUNG|nr:hypothetical protein BC938DRAFT_477526 [Jimgerdemannia flammicorona]